jgi:hypothetical protein
MEFDKVNDSGKRQEFETGSRRDTRDGKGRFDLISPVFLKRLAKHCENGATKYGDRNWEKGQPLSRYLDSASRHINNFLEGDRSEDHLAAVAWNIMGIIHTQEMIARGHLPKELDDLPPSYLPVGIPPETQKIFDELQKIKDQLPSFIPDPYEYAPAIGSVHPTCPGCNQPWSPTGHIACLTKVTDV